MMATTSTSAPSRGSVEDNAEVEVEVADDTRQQVVVDNRTTRLAFMPAIQEGQQFLKGKYAQQVGFYFYYSLCIVLAHSNIVPYKNFPLLIQL